MKLTLEEALQSYAAMMNTFDASHLEPLLLEDFHYSSQFVFEEITSKKSYLEYIVPKLQTLKSNRAMVWAELGNLSRDIPGPCVLLAQGGKDNLQAIVFGKIEGGMLQRLDLCAVPSPMDAERLGVYPGMNIDTTQGLQND